MSEEVPIELYRTTNNEFVKYVRYDDYKKLENIIKEVREFIYKCNDGKQGINYSGCSKLLEILDKGE